MPVDDRGIRVRGRDLQIRVSAGTDASGRRRVLTATVEGTSRAAWDRARRKRNELRRRALELGSQSAEPLVAQRTLAEVFDRWLAQAGPGMSANTLSTNRYNVDHYLESLKPVPLEKLRPQVIEDLYATYATRGLSPHTIRRVHGSLHRALEFARRWGWVSTNPAGVVEPPKLRRIDRALPKPESVSALMALFDKADPEFAAWLQVSAVTGARRGEICGLRWSDVNLERGEVTIRRAVVIGRDEAGREVVSVRQSTKTERPRTIALGVTTTELLRTHRGRLEGVAEACGVVLGDGYVFSREPDGQEPWHPDRVTKRFVRARARLYRLNGVDLSGARLGDLRHLVASTMLQQGRSVTETAKRLGNSPRTVLANYAHHLPADDHEVARGLEALYR